MNGKYSNCFIGHYELDSNEYKLVNSVPFFFSEKIALRLI